MRYSYTQANMYLKCGEQYNRRYVRGEKLPPAIAMIRGDGQHQAQERDLRTKLSTGQLVEDEAELLDLASDVVRRATESPDLVRLDEDERREPWKKVVGRTLDEATRATVLHHRHVAPRIEPYELEARLTFYLPELDREIISYVDVIERDGWIRDTKTSGRRPSGDVAQNSDQLALYALGHREAYKSESPGQSLDYLVLSQAKDKARAAKSKRKKAEQASLAVAHEVNAPVLLGDEGADSAVRFNGTQSRDDQARVVLRMQEAAAGIEAGLFPPAPQGSWWCAPKWCGYFHTCPYVRGGAVVTVPGVNEEDGSGDAQGDDLEF